MKNLNFGVLLLVMLFLVSCSSQVSKETSIEDQREEINILQGKLYADVAGPLDIVKADSIILLYTSFAEQFPEDSMSIQYLFKAAEVQMGINKDNECIATLSQIQNNYPGSKIMPMLLQFKAYVYDEKLHQYDKAKATLDELIENYPDNRLIPNAKAYREMIGKNPDEMFKKADSLHSANN